MQPEIHSLRFSLPTDLGLIATRTERLENKGAAPTGSQRPQRAFVLSALVAGAGRPQAVTYSL
ncbi:MAG: hypothetical protein D6691_04985 [Candidatus Hydrogenedentota bacterium]|nr:MAG: hypothetical protein D6691_04985 [Candidatus Hydrogenedentota bacterium]